MKAVNWKERILKVSRFVLANGRRPSQYKKKEAKLHHWMTMMLKNGGKAYQPYLVKFMDEFAPTRRWDSKGRKEEIIQFVIQNKMRPTPNGTSRIEQELAFAMFNYIYPSRAYGGVYDPEFKARLDALMPQRLECRKGQLFSMVKEFHNSYERLPLISKKRESEFRLALRLRHHLNTDDRFVRYIPLITNGEEK